MPTYDYVCEACGHAFEHFQSINSPRLRTCPTCKKRRLVRLVGAGAGLIFKGSGFYETDYKRAGQPPRPSEGGESTTKDSSNDSAKTATNSGKDPGKDASTAPQTGGKVEPATGPKPETGGKKASGGESSSSSAPSSGSKRSPKKGTS